MLCSFAKICIPMCPLLTFWLCLLSLTLETLSLNTLSMGGRIPDSLYNLLNLKVFMIHNNNPNNPGFEGSIKTEIGNLKNLTHLLLSGNPLTGTLPSELGMCESLGERLFSICMGKT